MTYRIVSLLIFISISLPLQGQELINLLFRDSEFELARLELYKQYGQGDSLSDPKAIAVIAYSYQLQDNHHRAKKLYRKALRKSGELSASFIDSINTNLCYSLMELNEFASAYGIFSTRENDHILPVKKRFFILTAERPNALSDEIFNSEEIESFNEFARTLKKPNRARLLSLLIPGLGQLYAEHTVDAAQSFLVVSAGFIYSTVAYQAYKNDDVGLGLTSITIGTTALFHYANVLSGYRAAIYRNMKLKQDYLEDQNLNIPPLDLSTSL